MTLSTRTVLAIVAASGTLTLFGTAMPALADDVHFYLVSRMNGTATLDDGTAITLWGFREGSGMGGAPEVPGPVLWANEGDHVFVHFQNLSPMPHTIHLHGLDVDQQNDGVPQTSFSVPMMGSYTYEFEATHAGSYNYHCHVETLLHLQMGMYGAVNVLPADGSNRAWTGGPPFDFERTWVSAEVDRTWNQLQTAADFTAYDPDYFLVNGKNGSQIGSDIYTSFDLIGAETALVRLSNMGYLPVRYDWDGLWAEAVASDGRPLPSSVPGQGLIVTPGERYDVLVRGSADGTHLVRLDYLDLYDEHVVGTAGVPVTVTGAVVDAPLGAGPSGLRVSAGAPLPFRDSVAFDVSTRAGSSVDIRILDVRGQLLGRYSLRDPNTFRWDGRGDDGRPVSAGVYYVRFHSDGDTVVRKAILAR